MQAISLTGPVLLTYYIIILAIITMFFSLLFSLLLSIVEFLNLQPNFSQDENEIWSFLAIFRKLTISAWFQKLDS